MLKMKMKYTMEIYISEYIAKHCASFKNVIRMEPGVELRKRNKNPLITFAATVKKSRSRMAVGDDDELWKDGCGNEMELARSPGWMGVAAYDPRNDGLALVSACNETSLYTRNIRQQHVSMYHL